MQAVATGANIMMAGWYQLQHSPTDMKTKTTANIQRLRASGRGLVQLAHLA
jgi:hypothetical protein